MDGRTDGRMDGRTDGRMDGRTDGKEGRKEGKEKKKTEMLFLSPLVWCKRICVWFGSHRLRRSFLSGWMIGCTEGKRKGTLTDSTF
jgi:hypothetical protein